MGVLVTRARGEVVYPYLQLAAFLRGGFLLSADSLLPSNDRGSRLDGLNLPDLPARRGDASYGGCALP